MATRWMTLSMLVILTLTGCATAAKIPVQPKTANATPAHTYTAPSEVLGINIAGDSPAAPWYFPSKPARATREVYHWLQMAKPTTVHLPSSAHHGQSADNIGPAVLYFTAQNGQQVTVHPTYSLAPGNLIKMNYIPNVVTYQKGTHRVYLVDPALYKWLKKDSWTHEFQMESYTDADTACRFRHSRDIH